jgi:hypothetical protein
VAIDPAYLAIRGEDARNLFAMGSLLRPLAELGQATGCPILIVHHCKRTRIVPGDPATLDDIAWAGFAEFSAQWLLLARRRRYDPDTGHHELWFTAGGRAGHHGLCALDVDEGLPRDAAPIPSPGPPGEGQGEGRNSPSPIPMGEGRGEGCLSPSSATMGGRIWKTAIRRVRSAEDQSDVRETQAREDRRVRRTSVIFRRDLHRTLALLESAPRPVSATYLRELLSLNGQRMKRVLAQLINDGVITGAPQFCGSRAEMSYSLTASYRESLGAQLAAADEHVEQTTESA